LSYQLATGLLLLCYYHPFSSSGNITIGHGDVPEHNNQIRVPGHPKWSQSRPLDHMDVSKNGPNEFERAFKSQRLFWMSLISFWTGNDRNFKTVLSRVQ